MSKARGLADLGNAYSDGALSNRNKIINGAMTIDQRNAGAAVTVTDAYTLDRWFGRENTDGALSFQQVVDAPAGLVNSAKVTVTTADASIGASQFAYFAQRLEGLNISDFAFGTASALPVTISFWVKSSLTGTFGGALRNGSNNNRSYPFTYVISAADTWEKKTITIAGDTTGTWATNNSQAMALFFGLGSGANVTGTAGAWAAADYQSASGAVDLISTLNATWQITGVQLEAGDTATPFEHRSYGQELALCQRYCQVSGGEQTTQVVMVGLGNGSSVSSQTLKPYVKFRALPTLSLSAASDFEFLQFSPFVTGTPTTASIITANSSSDYVYIDWNMSGGTSGATQLMRTANTNAKLILSAEL